MIAGQLWEAALVELPDLDGSSPAGEFEPLRGFLRERVHRHGRKHGPAEAIEVAVGSPLDSGPLLSQLRAKYGELYELGAEEAAAAR